MSVVDCELMTHPLHLPMPALQRKYRTQPLSEYQAPLREMLRDSSNIGLISSPRKQ